MNKFWNSVILPIFKEYKPKVIVEVGTYHGENTVQILHYLEDLHDPDAKLITIDPKPQINVKAWEDYWGDLLEVRQELSLDVLPNLEEIDAIIIDGDHNYYTVFTELSIVEDKFRGEIQPLIFLHDTGHPWARKDLYYDESTIPSEHIHHYEGGPRNGVLTAVEDFIKLSEYTWDLQLYDEPPDGLEIESPGMGILWWEGDK
jgi:hypothetical protein